MNKSTVIGIDVAKTVFQVGVMTKIYGVKSCDFPF
jgi:hypothetical protein